MVDELFGLSSGYVLDFTNSTFDDFFRREVGVDIYVQGPDSKEKRMRAFLIIGQPRAIVRALTSLREYRETTRISRGEAETAANARRRLSAIVERLGGALLPSFDLDNAPACPDPSSKRSAPNHAALDSLENEFLALYAMSDCYVDLPSDHPHLTEGDHARRRAHAYVIDDMHAACRASADRQRGRPALAGRDIRRRLRRRHNPAGAIGGSTIGLLVLGKQSPVLLMAVATIGNVLGSVTNWLLGRWIDHYRHRRWFPVGEQALDRATGWYRRWGRWSLLLS